MSASLRYLGAGKGTSIATILIIDDEAHVRASLRRILVNAGHAVLEAADGKEGLAVYRQGSIDLAIVDLLMPVKGGFETVEDLLEMDPKARILVATGVVSPGGPTDMAAKFVGVSRVLAKPFDEEELLAAVDEMLQAAE
jgi:CheY-like chemotaxis protein